jgi:hypothetical protein
MGDRDEIWRIDVAPPCKTTAVSSFTDAPNAKTVRIEHKILTMPTVEQAYYESRGHTKTETLTPRVRVRPTKSRAIVW